MKYATSILVATLLLDANSGQAAGSDSELISRGRAFAKLACSVCHVTSADKGETPLLRNPGPSFATIANRPSTNEAALHAFLSTEHRNMGPTERMPNPRLADYQIDEVIAYILSLRGGS